MAEWVLVEKTDGIVTALLNRPEAYNAFNMDLMESFASNLITLAADENVRGVVISGEGKAFCAGGDLKWALAFPHGPAAAFHELAARFHPAILEIRRMSKPVIAAVNGIAAGGGFSLALACDFRIMAESATFRQAYTSNGLCIDGGGSFHLPRLVGMARAMEIMAFDRPISSEQALAWGLATRLVPDGNTLEEASRMARELSSGSLHSFGWSKKLITDSFSSSFETHIERERRGLASCAAHPEGVEGLRAFAEKRKPVFSPIRQPQRS
ncbi:MAG TPA: enoyl-CoA hydratase [Syntrophobacteraceae bacterium]|nr:enoyl-CoA hydratase [Syntrophobacteraceae bacterium]HBD07154.1 enoyl-CoA hydratase [Syntrophobacteraceae bacterium]HBZ55057.1 enoyl-CoA hydratase [Syntrophobacteraceae bacterium]